jgi:hypothetical protein
LQASLTSGQQQPIQLVRICIEFNADWQMIGKEVLRYVVKSSLVLHCSSR